MSTTDEPTRTDAAPATTPADTAWMSWLRVIAICSVVAIHTVGFNAAEEGSLGYLRGQVARVLDFGSMYAVPVFVMLSGATMLDPARYRGPGAFLRKRATRLIPPLVFWHAWYVVFVLVVLDADLTGRDVVAKILNGNLYTALYFFWIVLGLSLLAPLFVPFVREQGRRATLIAGAGLAAVPALTLGTASLRGGVGPETSALSWWFPYLGLFLLGYGLRGVRLRGVALAAVTLAAGGLALLNAWQWRNPEAPLWLQQYSPVGYYSISGMLLAVTVYLAAQGLIAPGGVLRGLTGPRGVRIGRLFGDATLGVFGLHLTVLYLVQEWGVGGPLKASPTTHDMLLRLLVVLAITWAVVLLLRRLPVVRAVL